MLCSYGDLWHPEGSSSVAEAISGKQPRLVAFGLETLLATDPEHLPRVMTTELIEVVLKKGLKLKHDDFKKGVHEVLRRGLPEVEAVDGGDYKSWWRGAKKTWTPPKWDLEPTSDELPGGVSSAGAFLRRAFDLPKRSDEAKVDRRRLALTALAADRRCAYVARRRKRRIAWANGGPEIELGRESAVNRVLDETQALVVFETRALGVGQRDTRVVATCAMPIPTRWMLAAGLGRDRVAGTKVKNQRVVAQVERVYARRVLEVREEVPEGALAREATARCFLEGRLWPEVLATTRDRLEATALQARLDGGPPEPDLEAWVADRLEVLGMETGEDLALLSPEDLLAPALPAYVREQLDRSYPRRLELLDVTYEIRYDLQRKLVMLEKVAGRRKDPPPRSWLPAFRGFRIKVRHDRVERELR